MPNIITDSAADATSVDYFQRHTKLDFRVLAMPTILALVWAFFAAANPQFISPRNLSMLMIELSLTATLAFGMLLVILPGFIDLAAGSGVGLIGGLAAALIFRHDWPAPLALLFGMAVAIGIWTTMGLAIIKLKIQAFIITLGGLLILKGCFWLVIRSSTVPVAKGGEQNLYSAMTTVFIPTNLGLLGVLGVSAILALISLRDRQLRRRSAVPVESAELSFLKWLVTSQTLLLVALICNRYRGIPISFLLLCAAAIIVHYLIRHTIYGRYLFAIGGNEAAAHACGVPVDRAVVASFALMGLCVAITGYLQTAFAGASTTTVGELMELDAIAACVIGGASLKGGRGTVLGTLLGALIMASLLNGMTLLAVAPEYKLIVRGVVLVLAVLMDVSFRRGE